MVSIDGLSSTGLQIPISRIRQLANAAMDIEGLIPLWFGEPDLPSPQFVRDAANQSLADGKTFYVEGLGKPWLREAIANYMTDLYKREVLQDRIAVTTSGTNAVNLAFQMLVEPGDRMVTTKPAFPTLLTVPQLQHANVATLPLTASENGWSVDLGQLLDEAQKAKILLINSPNNPTGWTLSEDDIRIILEHCRKSGTWIISDEVYSRIVFEGKTAPSFATFADPEDRVIIINSFSKAWAMSGWRLGWLTLPPSLLPQCEKLMEFSMSCSPEFVQAAGHAAITQGETFVADQQERYRIGRDVSLARLSSMQGVHAIPPAAAFYTCFRIDDVTDGIDFAACLAREARVGIAPGEAFDASMSGWFRICFAKSEPLLHEAFDRMNEFLGE